ncbi:MAG: DEAD/DEAH box helicase [Acetobacteraceae bacterium]
MRSGELRPESGEVFRLPGETVRLFRHQQQALANRQMEELKRYIGQSGLNERLKPSFARYTGQEDDEDRQKIRDLKPDILLTNFMMLELLMTRQNALDREVIANAAGLDFIVLDELHTYRGREGADVAMLVRRLKDRLCRDREPVVIGTSATMASEDAANSAAAVARVASRLFGQPITADAVIGESLAGATDPAKKPNSLGVTQDRRLQRVVPSSWSSPVPNAGQWRDPVPPDVRFAGRTLQDESSALDERCHPRGTEHGG